MSRELSFFCELKDVFFALANRKTFKYLKLKVVGAYRTNI